MRGAWLRRPDLGHARRIAHTTLVRRWRTTRDSTAQLVAYVVVGVVGVPFLLAVVVGAYFGGRALVTGQIGTPLPLARTLAAGVWLFTLGITTFRTISRLSSLDALDGLLTTVPYRDVATGLLLAEALPALGLFLVPGVLGGVAFAVGTGSPATAPLVVLAGACAVGVGLVLGVALGFAVQAAVTRFPPLARHRTALGLLVFVAYMGLLLTNSFAAVVGPVVSAIRDSPPGWFADCALLATPVAADPAAALIALAGTPVAVVAGTLAAAAFAGLAWYADPAVSGKPETSLHTAATRPGPFERLFAPTGLSRATAWVAYKSWLRTARSPIKVVYAAYPLFFLFQPVQELLATGRVPVTFPALLALYGAWTTGAAFALNPLGDEGAVLPVTLTSPVTGRAYLSGLVLAGVSLGAPITALLTFAVGVLGPLSVPAAAATALGAVLVCCGAGALATGAGTLFPRFEASNVTRSRKAVVPSLWAFALYSAVLGVVWLPSTVLQLPPVASALAGLLGVSPATVSTVGFGVALVFVVGSGWLSVRYAASRFDRYTL